MRIGHDTQVAFGRATASLRAGPKKLASRKLGAHLSPTIEVWSRDFDPGGPLPWSSAGDRGAGAPPVLAWARVPLETRSIVVICEDEDAPLPEPFVHWLVYDIPPATLALSKSNASSFREGKNSRLRMGFTGPTPPRGHGPHHYHFQVFALDDRLGLETGIGRGAVLAAMRGRVLAFGDLCGTFERR